MTLLHLDPRRNGVLVDMSSHHPDAVMALEFHRTRRVAEDGATHGLPPSLGLFPLMLMNEAPAHLVPEVMRQREGIIMPIHANEAMWINFLDPRTRWRNFGGSPAFLFAVQIAAGKIDAITGKPFIQELVMTGEQFNYMIPGLFGSGRQKWLDGFKTEDGTVRQFVAAPLGEGRTVEEQLTGEARFGGIQVTIRPMKAEVWERVKPVESRDRIFGHALSMGPDSNFELLGTKSFGAKKSIGGMGLGAGGKINQTIERPKFTPDDFAPEAQRMFITLVDSDKEWPLLNSTQLAPPKPFDPRPIPPKAPTGTTPVTGLPGMEAGMKPANAVGGGTGW